MLNERIENSMKLIKLHLLEFDCGRFFSKKENIIINPTQISQITNPSNKNDVIAENSRLGLLELHPFNEFPDALSPCLIKMINGDLIKVAESMDYILSLANE